MEFRRCRTGLFAFALACSCVAQGQDQPTVTAGKTLFEGRESPYEVRYLPVSSFPELPGAIAARLRERGCLIPQTYEAHRPENVVHASLEHAGSSDWAILCSVNGEVSLLVFFGRTPDAPEILRQALETNRLQAHPGTDVLGFNWGIDPASPARVRQAQVGVRPRPPRLEHDALADSVIEHKTIYHYFADGRWNLVPLSE